jgi:serine/threonine protein kinase
MNLETNTKFAEFTLISRKGEGSTAEVWEAVAPNGEYKALKIFAPHFLLDEASKKMIQDEFKYATKLSHPHLIIPENYVESEGAPAFVLPLMHKSMWQDLQDRQPNGQSLMVKPYEEKTIALILAHIGKALIFLHQHSIVHNDIKPANILVNQPVENQDHAKTKFYLTDFGISQDIRDTILRQTRSIHSLTFAYAAPEKLKGESGGTPESDIFALGASMYELCFGIQHRSPLGQILNNNGEIHLDSANYSHPFLHLLKKTLEKKPADRISLSTLTEACESFLATGKWPEKSMALPSGSKSETTPSGQSHNQSSSNQNVEDILQRYRQKEKLKNKGIRRSNTGILVAVLLFLALGGGGFVAFTLFSANQKWDEKIKINNELWLVQKDKKIGILNTQGDLLVKPEHESALIYENEVVFFTNGNTTSIYPINK